MTVNSGATIVIGQSEINPTVIAIDQTAQEVEPQSNINPWIPQLMGLDFVVKVDMKSPAWS